MIFVTGGAGFIGSHFIKEWLKSSDEAVLNIDLLTYAGNLANLKTLENDSRYLFYQSDIADSVQIKQLLDQYSPRAVIHFAAESHVDKSIVGPEDFIQTNIVGSFRLLNTVLAYWQKLSVDAKNNFRFLHISSDFRARPRRARPGRRCARRCSPCTRCPSPRRGAACRLR